MQPGVKGDFGTKRKNVVKRYVSRRFVLCLSIVFALGIILWYTFEPWVCFTVCAICPLIYFVNRSFARSGVILIFLILGMLVCAHSIGSFDRLSDFSEGSVSLAAKVTGVRDDGDSVLIELSDITANGRKLNSKSKLYLDKNGKKNIALPERNDLILSNAELCIKNAYGNFGCEYILRRNASAGLWIYFTSDNIKVIDSDSPGLFEGIDYAAMDAADGILEQLEAYMPPDEAGLAYGMLVGDSSKTDDETYAVFKDARLLHLLAVSGLHVSFVASILFAILSFLPGTNETRIITLAVALAFYAAVCGYSASVIRAGIMTVASLVASNLRRQGDMLTDASIALFVILLFRPLSIFDSGLQMSFSAVTGIALLYLPIARMLQKLRFKRKLADALSISFSAQFGVMPVLLIVYGSSPLISFVINPIVIPLAGVALVASWITVFAGAVGAGFAARLTGWFSAFLLRGITEFSAFISGYDIDYIIPRYAAWLVSIAFLTFVLLYVKRIVKNRRARRIVAVVLIAVVISTGAAFYLKDRNTESLTVFDVGQGQCVLVKTHGKNILIDCGTQKYGGISGSALVSALLAHGASRIDAMIITHMDSDHDCLAGYVINEIDVRLAIAGREELKKIAGYSDDIELVYGGDIIGKNMWDTGVSLLRGTGAEDNSRSFVVSVRFDDFSALIMGDAEMDVEDELTENGIGHYDVLVAGHHGSKYATGMELLREVSPNVVLISAGFDNQYGHPSDSTIKRISSYDIVAYDTAMSGEISAEYDGGLRIRTYMTDGGPWRRKDDGSQ